MHLQPVCAETDLIKQLLSILDPALSPHITVQVMTISEQSTGHHHAVSTFFKSLEDVQYVEFAGARQSDDF